MPPLSLNSLPSPYSMNALHSELERLYWASPSKDALDTSLDSDCLITPDAKVRAVILELARPADWGALLPLWQGVQADLELPAPAIAVSGVDGYQLWFSLLEPVPAAQACSFLQALQKRYLGTVAFNRLTLWPCGDSAASRKMTVVGLVPSQQAGTGRWSAFVAADLASIFSEEPWLDLAPNPEAQATVLSRMESIQPSAFETAWTRLAPLATNTNRLEFAPPSTDKHDLHPQRFLQDVLNDPSIDLQIRVEAAKALLPFARSA